MEIWGIVKDQRGFPIREAMIQRYYPTGEIYSSPVLSGEGGLFNGRVPQDDHYWIVSAPGFLPRPISLEGVHTNDISTPILVTLEADPMTAVKVEMQEPAVTNYSPVLWGIGGAAAAAVGLWYLGNKRDKVKMRKIIN